MDVQPQHITLARLLEGRLFRIPDYQRSYSWTRRERKDLFEDLASVATSEDGHFMATVVCLRRESVRLGIDEYTKLDVVDGQQRLTTLIMLLNAIRIAFEADQEDVVAAQAANDLRNLLVKAGGDDLLLLQTNHDTSHYFADYLLDGQGPRPTVASTVADRELLSAISECTGFVRKWREDGRRLTELASIIRNRLSLVLHEIADERTVYTVFEVLNSRGMAVSWLDRLKSVLMGAAFALPRANSTELIKDLHNIWRDVYATIGLRQGLSTESLRFAATLRIRHLPSRPLSEEAAVDELRSNLTSARQIRLVGRWLLAVTRACDKFYQNRRLSAVTEIVQARLLAVAIELRSDLSDRDRDRLLSAWEKVTFRVFGMMRKDRRSKVGEYVRLSWRTVNEELPVAQIMEGIEEVGKEFPINQAVRNLRGENCYEGWAEQLRYFLFRYEEHLAAEDHAGLPEATWTEIWNASATRSIDHVWPQSVASDDVVHNLGNLVLLPPEANSSLGAKAPREKFDTYRRTGLRVAIEVADYQRWNKENIRRRERELLRWARDQWG